MYNFESYAKATSVADAIRLLKKTPGARLIAGGTDVLIDLRDGKKNFRHLVDVHDLSELRRIHRLENGDLVIGSGVTFTDLAESPPILACVPMLAESVATVAGPQLRNMATIGGNLCNGMTSADGAPPLFTYNAVLNVEGAAGKRDVPIKDFYLGPGKVALGSDEVLTAITISPDNYANLHGVYHKYAMREAMDIATIGCAALIKLDGNSVADLRIAYGVAGPVPLRCKKAEAFSKGKTISKKLLMEIADIVLKDLNPRDSWRASKEFRVHIIKTLAGRVFEAAILRAGGTLV
jgi:xanthine dehydrogenase FAD-binding subunit